MAANRYTLLDASSGSGTDEDECENYFEDKEKALKAYFIKQNIRADYCPGCPFLFYSRLYWFMNGSATLMEDKLFRKIMDTYDKLLAAFFEMNTSGPKFNQEYYELFYTELTKLVIERRKKLSWGFPRYFASLYEDMTTTWKYCGGKFPGKLLAHQKF